MLVSRSGELYVVANCSTLFTVLYFTTTTVAAATVVAPDKGRHIHT